jgi:methylated-DNA-[protein]-cysteine S-methyltransferase
VNDRTAIDPGTALREAAGAAATRRENALERFRARAADEGLLDVAYAEVDSPFGTMLVAGTERGLVRTSLPAYPSEDVLAELSLTVSPRLLESPARLDEVRRQLDDYFEGRLERFSVDLDWRLVRGFQTRVLRATAAIPFGQTRSYTEVAEEAGNPRAYRAAGTALGRNPLAPVVPCHRVIQAGGDIGNYGGGPEMKRALLALEGALGPN